MNSSLSSDSRFTSTSAPLWFGALDAELTTLIPFVKGSDASIFDCDFVLSLDTGVVVNFSFSSIWLVTVVIVGFCPADSSN